MNKSAFFDSLAKEWDSQEVADISERLARVVLLSDLQPGQRVLDVGTGTGVLIPYILEAIGESGLVVALDISLQMLKQANARRFPPNVHLVHGDMQRAGLKSQSFHRVLCNAVFPHFDDKRTALQEAWRVLCPGGLIVISHPIGREAVNRIHSQHRAVFEDRVPTADKMRAMLSHAGWVDVEVIDEPEFYLARGRKPITSLPTGF